MMAIKIRTTKKGIQNVRASFTTTIGFFIFLVSISSHGKTLSLLSLFPDTSFLPTIASTTETTPATTITRSTPSGVDISSIAKLSSSKPETSSSFVADDDTDYKIAISSTAQPLISLSVTSAIDAAMIASKTKQIVPNVFGNKPDTDDKNNNEKTYYYLFEIDPRIQQGFGSLAMNMFFYALYYEAAQNRTLVVDERFLVNYPWNSTHHGMYENFFVTKFPVYREGMFGKMTDVTTASNNISTTEISICENILPLQFIDRCRILHELLIVGRTRLNFVAAARAYFGDELVYPKMVEYTCRQLPSLSPQAQKEVTAKILSIFSIPTTTATATATTKKIKQIVLESTTTTTATTSFIPSIMFPVAFHIRRGDKITEDRYYKAAEYVDMFVEKAGHDYAKQVQDCFVATDDYAVIDELQTALRNRGIPCDVWTLTDPYTETTRGHDDFILFLAEMQLLIHSEYFIGTFSSNVGTAVAVLRGCPTWLPKQLDQEQQTHETEQIEYVIRRGDMNNYFKSYSVSLKKIAIPK